MSNGARRLPLILALLLLTLVSIARPLFAQTTVATGSIVGTVCDPSGAFVAAADVTITDVATGQVIRLTTNSSGTFNSGALVPGNYKTLVSAKGFSSTEAAVTVLVGNTATMNVNLQIGSEKEVVEVEGSALQVNTEQATVQGVLNDQQIGNLPINGRNFLDLAQLEPGVQIQDAANFVIGKDGYASISFGGRFGRTARIEVDGIDVSDEIFGSTTMNIPASGIQEFQLSQSSLDLSTELTTSGAINVTTRSGTNAIHGEAFDLFRDGSLAAALPTPPGLSEPFQRSQYGGRLGGPIVKNKLFYFLDAERTLQHEQAPVLVAAPFQQYSGNFSSPFHENNLMAKGSRIQGELLHRLNRDNFKAAVSADIEKHAAELDGGRRGIHTRVSSALLLESIPLQPASGMDKPDVTLAVLHPDEAGHEPGEALDRLVGLCWHTYPLPGGRGWQFRYEPNVLRQIDERKAEVPIEDAKNRVLADAQQYFGGPTFQLVSWPTNASQVKERAELQLVLCENEKIAKAVCEYSDDTDPQAPLPRRFRNAIVAVTVERIRPTASHRARSTAHCG